MKRRDFLKAGTGALLSSGTLLKSCLNPSSKKLNVLYICIEDLGPRLGCYGHPVVLSPNIDAFAQESVMLKDCHCQVPLCTPSRTSILTGIRPSTSGIVKIDDDWKSILPGAVSLPRHFRDNGYLTYRVGKISDPRDGGSDDAWIKSKEDWGVKDNNLVLPALEEAAEQSKPFFLAIGYKQVHEPWQPAQTSMDQYDLAKIKPEGRGRLYKNREMSEAEARRLIQKYYASITDVDILIGELLKKSKTLGLFENTIIVLGALDHGYSLGEHAKWGKGNNFDTETQVPLFIRIPGNPNNGIATQGITELVDIYPTLIELCGLPHPPQTLEGISMRPLLDDPARAWKKAAFTHRAYHLNDCGIKTKEYTLIRRSDGIQLFDRINDPKNLKNIAADQPDVVNRLSQMLAKGWKQALPENLN